MEISKKTLVILAGGLGSRYKNLKQVDGISPNGSTVMEYSVYDALIAGFNKIVLIINNSVPEDFKNKISKILEAKNIEVHWVIQDLKNFVSDEKHLENRTKPWGTAHAVLCASQVVQENFVVINADDFYGKSSYEKAFQFLDSNKITEKNYAIIAFPLKNTLSKNGSVSRGICSVDTENKLNSVEEITQIFNDESGIFYI